MITDPYKILEISPSATDDEVKKAYRELSRKYHPDSYVNNPLSGLAEEKFKEVQEAYNQIMKDRENGYSNTSTNGYGYGQNSSGYGQGGYNSYGGNDSGEFQVIHNMIAMRRYREALTQLGQMQNRNARWYYYSALANSGVGNNIQARNFAQTAYNMEPTNRDYANLLDQLQYGAQRYQTYGGNYGRASNDDACDMCCKLWMLDSLCECMGGDLCACM